MIRNHKLKNLLFTTMVSLSFTINFVLTAQATTQGNADAIYTNGKIYTVTNEQPWAEAFAIKDGVFIKVGTNEEVKALVGDNTLNTDLKGRMVMPGLIDTHVHPLSVANDWANLQLKNPTDAEAILEEVKAYANENPDLEKIQGSAWNLGVFDNDSPRKELLDAIDSERPIYLMSQTGHSAWVNSKALEMAGITKDTANGGPFLFDVDKTTGEPSGTIREFAMGAVERILPATDSKTYGPALARVISEFNEFGFTSLKCAEGRQAWNEGAATLDREGGLNARLFTAWEWRSHYTSHSEEEQDRLPYRWKEFASNRVDPRHVKMFYDGGPDSYTALLLEDYEDRPGFKGQSNLPKDEFIEQIAAFNAKGIGVMVHVLGDGGAREVVEIFEQVRKLNGDNGIPLHFSHAWMAKVDDIKRLSKIKDAVLDFSPALSYPAPEIEGSMAPPIGQERYQSWFNVRSSFVTGMPVGFGSDWASSLIPDPNGFHQMQSWVTRQNPEIPDSPTLNADQKITLEQAVHGFTQGGAEVIGFGWGKKIGSIEIGKIADFIILDRNIFEIPITDLHKTKVNQTILAGEVVFDRTEELEELSVVEIEITNPNLKNALDSVELNLLVANELAPVSKRSCGIPHDLSPERSNAPDAVKQAFGALTFTGFRLARPTRKILWKGDGEEYWIQWTQKGEEVVLWAYDNVDRKAVEVLRVREK